MKVQIKYSSQFLSILQLHTSIFLSSSSASLSSGRSSSSSDMACRASLSLASPASNSLLVSAAAPRELARSSRRPSRSDQRVRMFSTLPDTRWLSGAVGSRRDRTDSPNSVRCFSCGCCVRNSSRSTCK